MLDEVALGGAFFVAFFAGLLATPAAIHVARRLGFYDHPDPRLAYKIHANPTPYLGGAAVMASFAFSVLLFGGWTSNLAPILAGAFFLWLVGTLDDYHPLPPFLRILSEAAVAVALWLADLGWSVSDVAMINLALTIAWIIAVVNAVNVMDNMDGVTTVIGSVSAAAIALVALLQTNVEVAVLASSMAGACLGFLPYNSASPARIFLGDGGSRVIGFVLGATLMALPIGETLGWSALVPASLIVGLTAFNSALVTVSRRLRGASILVGGQDSVTHRLRAYLLSARAVAYTLGLFQALLCTVAIALVELKIVGMASILATAACLAVAALAATALETRISGGVVRNSSSRSLASSGDRSSEKIRVLHIISRMAGGSACQVSLVSGRLDRARYTTLLVTGKVGRREASSDHLVEYYGATRRTVDSLGSEIRPLHDARALVALIRIMQDFRPDIVVTHAAKAGLLGRVAALTAGRHRPLIVHTYHGHVLEGYFGRFQTLFYRLLERWLGRVSDCLIGVSQATVDDLIRLKIAPTEKFRVVQLGLELERFAATTELDRARFRREVGARENDVLLAYVGRLVPIKRVDRAIRAVAEARAIGTPVRLAVIGDGLLREDLEMLAEGLSLDGSVRFLGYRRNLEEVTAGCDAAVLTSDNEGTPMSLIEAAATGRPAIATAVGGVPEVVRDTGILVSPGDQQGLAAAIVRLSQQPSLRHELGRRARGQVVARFAADRLLHDTDVLYTELLASRSLADRESTKAALSH